MSFARRDDRLWETLKLIAARAEAFEEGRRQGLREAMATIEAAPMPDYPGLAGLFKKLSGLGWAEQMLIMVKGTRLALAEKIKALIEAR